MDFRSVTTAAEYGGVRVVFRHGFHALDAQFAATIGEQPIGTVPMGDD